MKILKTKYSPEGMPMAQPFFTTNPTGQACPTESFPSDPTRAGRRGTGLGLSLSYDIVKAHQGELKVNSEAGIGSEFIIQLPVL